MTDVPFPRILGIMMMTRTFSQVTLEVNRLLALYHMEKAVVMVSIQSIGIIRLHESPKPFTEQRLR